jgi:hypothetical protein
MNGPRAAFGMTLKENRVESTLLRRINERRLLEVIQQQGPSSRAMLTRVSGLTAPTVSKAVDSLLKRGLVEELEPVEQALGYSVVLHVILAGCFTYGFTRHIGLKPPAALVASLSYMFSGFIISRAMFLSMVNAAAWLPLIQQVRFWPPRAVLGVTDGWLGAARIGLVVFVLMPLGVTADYFVYPSHVGEFLRLRLLCSLLIVGVWLLHSTPLAKKFYPLVGKPSFQRLKFQV